jgi:hypothetical protein
MESIYRLPLPCMPNRDAHRPVHDRSPRRGTWSRHAVATLIAIAWALLWPCDPSHAVMRMNGTTVNGTTVNGTTVNGTTVNGTTVNGTTVNGTTVNGTSHHGMRVSVTADTRTKSSPRARSSAGRLTAIKIDPDTGTTMIIHIRAFRGDTVEALVWSPGQGSREVTLPASELVGMQWVESRCAAPGDCTRVTFRVVAGDPDTSRSTMPAHGDNHDVWLFEVQHTAVAEPGEQDWQSYCQPDREQQTRGLFLDGQWRDDGSWDPHGHTLACTNGALAKCARNWGYKPWKQVATADGQRISLQPLHQACTRAARADYCGDGMSHTRNGTLIDLFDRHGLNVREQVEGFEAEAGFTAQGAAWIARPRLSRRGEDRGRHVTLPTCTRPRQVAPGSSDPALVYVWSRPGVQRAGR